MKKYLPPVVVAIGSAVTHFIYFGYPAQIVFDETYNSRFLGDYASGSFYFDVHPPLAKLLVYVFGFLTGASYHTDMGTIGAALPHSVDLLRLVPMVCGFILPLVIYAICRNIGMSRLSAMTAGLLIAFENSLVVQSRFILFDAILVLAGFVSVLFYQEYIKRRSLPRRNLYLIGSAIFAAAAFSIKWTGMAFPLMIVLLELYAQYQNQIAASLKKKIRAISRTLIPFVAVYVCVGVILYTSVFALHFALLPNAGAGDAFVSSQFRQENFPSKFIDLNYTMYEENAHNMPPHQYQSAWWTWPLLLRPIFYWQDHDEYIYPLLGNPIIYWLGTASVISILGYLFLKKRTKSDAGSIADAVGIDRRKSAIFIIIGFLVNYAPFILITRPMFLYHYEAALVMSIVAIAWIIDDIRSEKWKMGAAIAILAVCISAFVFFSPLTYGLHLDQAQLHARMWLSSWR